jgi:hypothetical protein
MINKVKDFQIGDILTVEKVKCKIVGFPTRSMVLLENINWIPGEWSSAKLSINDLRGAK